MAEEEGQENEDGDQDDDEDEGQETHGQGAALALDPYANLDGAFGDVDQPKSGQRSKTNDDDLLF